MVSIYPKEYTEYLVFFLVCSCLILFLVKNKQEEARRNKNEQDIQRTSRLSLDVKTDECLAYCY